MFDKNMKYETRFRINGKTIQVVLYDKNYVNKEGVVQPEDWMVVKTKDSNPGLGPWMVPGVEKGEKLYYDNEHQDVIRAVEVRTVYDNNTIETWTWAEGGNSGSGVFDEQGNLMAILTNHSNDGKYTYMVLLTDDIIEQIANLIPPAQIE